MRTVAAEAPLAAANDEREDDELRDAQEETSFGTLPCFAERC